MAPEKLLVSWIEINDHADLLTKQIKGSKTKFSKIFAIPRGGLVLGVMLSHRLGIPMAKEQDGQSDTLIVDEIWDTGKTAIQYCAKGQKFACIHFKPEANKTDKKPDFYCSETDAWVNYPWECAEK
ncbi:MAG: hypothetical protein Q8N77_00165 [Nanoarchaeota archaeon]|nr:hypothetical protein [Nanoarchaeota archaeon]